MLDRLSQAIEKDVPEGNWKPASLSKTKLYHSHVMFTDNIVFFREASTGKVNTMLEVLKEIKKASEKTLSKEKLIEISQDE